MLKVKIEYNQKKTLISCDENVKCVTLFRKYALLESLNYEDIYFVFGGDVLSTNDNKRKKLKDIFPEKDETKYQKIHSIIVSDNEFGRTESSVSTASMAMDEYKEKIIEYKGSEKEFEEKDLSEITDLNELIEEFKNIKIISENDKSINDEGNEKLNNKIDVKINNAIKDKYFSIIKSYLIIIFQFMLISLLYGIFSSKDLNNIFKNSGDTITIIFILLILVIVIGVSISIFFIPRPYLIQKLLIITIFFIIHTLCLLFISFLLTKYIDYKYILSSLVLEVLIALTMEIYIAIKYFQENKQLKDFSYNKYSFLFIPFISNLLAIIVLYFAVFKNTYKIIYISIISIILIITHFLITYFKFKNYKMKEYILTTFCISLTTFYLIGMGINKCYKNIKSQFIQYHGANIKPYILKIYSILLIEFTSIGLFVFLGYFYNLNKIFADNALYFFIPCVAILIIVYILKFFKSKKSLLYSSFILFIPIFIISLFLVSYLIEDKNIILCCLSLIYLDIVSMEFYALFCKLYDALGMIISPIIINAISLPLFYFFWIKDVNNIIYISTFALIILIFNFFIFKKLFLFINDDFGEVLSYVIYINLSLLYSIDLTIDTIKLKYNYKNIDDNNPKSILSLKINSVLLLYLIILIIVNKIYPRDIIDSDTYLGLSLNFFIFISGLFSIYVYYTCYYRNEQERKKSKIIFFILNIFYIVLAILIITMIPYEQALIILLLLLIDIFTMELYSLFTDNFSCYFFVICPFVFHGITTLVMHLSFNINLLILGITLGYLVYVIIIELILFNKIEIYVDEGCYSVSLINYLKCFISGYFVKYISVNGISFFINHFK